jgi:gas vesicle protein
VGVDLGDKWNRFCILGLDGEKLTEGETMSDTRTGDRAEFFLLGAAIGAAAALLMAPASGKRTRRRLVRKRDEVVDYLIDAGRELVEKCEDLYERSEELVEDATHELSGKYRALHEHSKQLLDDAETILRRAKGSATGR